MNKENEHIKKHTKKESGVLLMSVNCYNCGEEILGKKYRWYHSDQDDLICESCAKITKHTDTSLAGINVKQEGDW